MSQLVPSYSPSPVQSPANVPKPVQRQVDAAHHAGVIAASRLTGQAFAASVAMQHIATLSTQEFQYVEMCPWAADRFKHVVDAFSMGAASQLQQLGWH